MLTLPEANRIALEALATISPRSKDEYAFYDESARCKRYGWILFFNSRKYVETGDFLHAFGGNGPIVVMHDGKVHFLGTAKAVETTIADFEAERGLG